MKYTTTNVVDGQLGLSGVDDDDSDYDSVTKTYQQTCQCTVIGGYGQDFEPVLSAMWSAMSHDPNAVTLLLSVPSCLGAACLVLNVSLSAYIPCFTVYFGFVICLLEIGRFLTVSALRI